MNCLGDIKRLGLPLVLLGQRLLLGFHLFFLLFGSHFKLLLGSKGQGQGLRTQSKLSYVDDLP